MYRNYKYFIGICLKYRNIKYIIIWRVRDEINNINEINYKERGGNIRNEIDLIQRIQCVANKYEILSYIDETKNYTYFKMWTELEQLIVEIRRDMIYKALNDIVSNEL